MLCGGWSKFCALTPEEKKLFEDTVQLDGVGYEPFAAATQVVQGTNYKYLCNAVSTTNPPRLFLAEVKIFAPLPSEEGKEPSIVDIREIED